MEQLIEGNIMGVKCKYKDHAEWIPKINNDYNNRSKVDSTRNIP